MPEPNAPLSAFIEAACVPLDGSHTTGTLERAEAILAAHPDLADQSVYAAAILGDDAAVRRFLASDPVNATAKGGPRFWDALTHLCFSRFLRLDRARSDGFVRAASALLDAGASANTGWYETNHQPRPVWGSALYGAAGVAHHAGLTRLLLERGADPALEGTHPEVCRSASGKTAVSLATRRGRADVLELLERRGVRISLQGVERLIAACARNDVGAVSRIVEHVPGLLSELRAQEARLLAEFAGNGNTDGIRQLLNLGVDVHASLEEGHDYFGIAKHSTALHVAAWRARHGTVKLLIERGADIHSQDGNGRTPLALAVRACVDSYWTEWRSPESVHALLQAGASVRGVLFPSGYAEVDDLLKSHAAAA